MMDSLYTACVFLSNAWEVMVQFDLVCGFPSGKRIIDTGSNAGDQRQNKEHLVSDNAKWIEL